MLGLLVQSMQFVGVPGMAPILNIDLNVLSIGCLVLSPTANFNLLGLRAVSSFGAVNAVCVGCFCNDSPISFGFKMILLVWLPFPLRW